MSRDLLTGCAVVGAQLGSEGKGAIVERIASDYDVHVRTGGPNAGHTIYHEGREFKMQSIPCGWINPKANLIIGPGAMLSPSNFFAELAHIERKVDPHVADRIFIDRRATVITKHLAALEGGHGRTDMAHGKIGSTGEGVGAARMARINRGAIVDLPQHFSAEEYANEVDGALSEFISPDVTRFYKGRVLLEGTQGFGLSLTTGEWPFVTSAATTAAQLASDAGFPVTKITRVIAVARTFPIRVAGNSGELWGETTWEDLGLRPEYTTVTRKVRRVGRFDIEMVADAVRINGATELALTCLDQLFPEMVHVDDEHSLHPPAMRFIEGLESHLNIPVTYVGTGPRKGVDRGLAATETSPFIGGA